MKNMDIKQEIMEKDMDQVAGGVNVTNVVDTVTKVVDTVSKFIPGQKKEDGGKTEGKGGAAVSPSVTIKQDLKNNMKVNNQSNVNGPNSVNNITF